MSPLYAALGSFAYSLLVYRYIRFVLSVCVYIYIWYCVTASIDFRYGLQGMLYLRDKDGKVAQPQPGQQDVSIAFGEGTHLCFLIEG